jgi:PKD repeat protein
MKFLHPLMVGMLLFGATLLNAQEGIPIQNNSAAKHVGDNPTPLAGNGLLGPAFQASACGLNYTTASNRLGQRFSPAGVLQPATFTISGIPASATIMQAFVWCDASGNGVPITINVTNPSLVSSSVGMTLVGTDVTKCWWSYANSTTYRADVTSTIAGNGNYVISGFPTGFPNDVDGATMVVIWSDNSAGWQGDLIIWDGAMTSQGGAVSQTMTGFNACSGNVFNARAFMGVGDFQFPSMQITLNGMPPFSVANDWWNFTDVPTTVNPGQNTSLFGVNNPADCYNVALYGLYFQSDCQTCQYGCEAKPDFKWDGCNPVKFDGYNTGVSPVVSWFWQFGDGGTSTLEDPIHNYAIPGAYKVCLTIISVGSHGETCCEQICYEVIACQGNRCEVKPEFHWHSDPHSHQPTTVYLSDATTFVGGGICNYYIDFGDGSPIYNGPTFPSTHVYPANGTYEMCMTVTVCIYDANGEVIKKCEEKVCHNITVGPHANSGRMAQPSRPMPSSGISVFPNPANSQLNIELSIDNAVTVKILNASGQEVAIAKPSGKNTYNVDVTNLAVGVYFVTVQMANGTIEKQLFVKE